MLNALTRACETAYDVAYLAVSSAAKILYPIRRHKLLFDQLYRVGNRSLGIVAVMGCFIGMALALQTGYQLRRFNQQERIGLMGLAVVREFGPVITAFLLAGRIGSSYAAEIGTMKVDEQIDALQVMGVDPVGYLATPRVMACVVMVPLLCIYSDFVAMLGGALVAETYVNVPPQTFFRVFFNFITMADVWRSMAKCLAFGGIIAITGCYFGFNTTGGAEGVGRSTTQTVVYALLAVLITDYFLEKTLLAL
ncbi:MAG: ABC transporter permease [Planctomycetota bacterium]